ncbi:antA/AntB antirepressor family protein [Anaerophilus nitritogenes]|uniref:antA/AntB antirepressor family protein n=1 Tax=Anaerophilus nitritogenes TaxID=2498136 RepID=UPI00101D7EE4|nr:antA/AntB antirepressor family protein [Anaerophilus nitritogenes]
MRIVKINDIKVKVFEKKELIEKLGFTEEDAKLVMKYQKTFPELLQDQEGFVIDGETLCNQLGVKDNHSTWLLANNVSKTGKLIKYRMTENVDYHLAKSQTVAKGTEKNIIKLTKDCAKKIAMRQNNKMGDLVADYFILVEKALRDYEHWLMVREPQKEGYKKLSEILDTNYQLTHEGKEAPAYIFSNEADMINRKLLGISAKKLQNLLDTKDKIIREHFTIEINKAINEIQTMDMGLVMAGLDYEARRKVISNICNTKFKNIQLMVNELKEIA